MTLVASLRRLLEDHTLSRDQRAETCCQLAKELEDKGDYEGARGALAEFWPMVGERPHLEMLERRTAAEVLLRAGVLTGRIGSASQLEGALEIAKSLINESIHIFKALPYAKREIDGQIELAGCYWREGAYDKARGILQDVLARLSIENEQKAKALVSSAMVERSAARHHDALRILHHDAPLFKKINSHLLKGIYHSELGMVLNNLAVAENRADYFDKALVEFTAASFHFKHAKHTYYIALVENNLGILFLRLKKFNRAHEYLNHARHLFAYLRDRGSAALVDETRAQVLLAEGQYAEAEKVANAAVRILQKGGQKGLLVEALKTHGTALARLGQYHRARSIFKQAIEVAEQTNTPHLAGEVAISIIEELGEHLVLAEMQSFYEQANQCLTSSEDAEMLRRLLRIANRVLSATRETHQMLEASEDVPDFLLDAEFVFGKGLIRRSEAHLIQEALTKAEGSITQAARLLGITHQRLSYILQTRHSDLLAARTPPKRRRRRGIEPPVLGASH